MWDNRSYPPKEVAINCLTISMKDFINKGYISYEYDENQNIVEEKLFSIGNTLLANIAYEYFPNTPFPIITEYNAIEDDQSIKQLLNRNQKLWFYKDSINLSKTGKIIGYRGNVFYPNKIDDYVTFTYNNKDNIISGVGMSTNDRYSSEHDKNNVSNATLNLDFSYRENHLLESLTYNRPAKIYGTYDSIGEVLYDQQGQMIYNDFYVTHGSISCFYFYKEGGKRPWASIFFDSMPYS